MSKKEIVNDKASYLQGEFNAVQACGTAISEASSAIKAKFTDEEKIFILLEFQGIMFRASMLIKKKNEEIGML